MPYLVQVVFSPADPTNHWQPNASESLLMYEVNDKASITDRLETFDPRDEFPGGIDPEATGITFYRGVFSTEEKMLAAIYALCPRCKFSHLHDKRLNKKLAALAQASQDR